MSFLFGCAFCVSLIFSEALFFQCLFIKLYHFTYEILDSLIVFIFSYTGTERCNDALQKLEKQYDIVVNIQGDEPLIEPEIIDGVVKALQVIPFLHPVCLVR